MPGKPKSAYARAGVDIQRGDRFVAAISKLVQTTLNEKVIKSPTGYAGLYELNPSEYLAATTDGVGTKLKLAFALKKHDTVGIDLVAMSVNDLLCVGARPLFFLDYFATGKLDLKTATQVLKGITDGCRQARVALIGGETAEMPGMYASGEYDLAGFAVGLVAREKIIDGTRVRPGDVLLGLESSGPHSNGFSLIRKLIRPSEKALLKDCLRPTKIYVDDVQTLQQEVGPGIKGMAHITGSGFLNVPRINEGVDYRIELPAEFRLPKIFEELRKRGRLSWEELYATFNMGFGMVIAVEPVLALRAREALKRKGVAAYVLGQVQGQSRPGRPRVEIRGPDFRVALDY